MRGEGAAYGGCGSQTGGCQGGGGYGMCQRDYEQQEVCVDEMTTKTKMRLANMCVQMTSTDEASVCVCK